MKEKAFPKELYMVFSELEDAWKHTLAAFPFAESEVRSIFGGGGGAAPKLVHSQQFIAQEASNLAKYSSLPERSHSRIAHLIDARAARHNSPSDRSSSSDGRAIRNKDASATPSTVSSQVSHAPSEGSTNAAAKKEKAGDAVGAVK